MLSTDLVRIQKKKETFMNVAQSKIKTEEIILAYNEDLNHVFTRMYPSLPTVISSPSSSNIC